VENLSLQELKAQNAGSNEEEQPIIDNAQEVVKDDYVEETELNKAADVESYGEQEDPEDNVEVESWMQSEKETHKDDHESGFKPNHEAAKRRRQNQSLRADIKEKDSELDELRKQVEALKAGSAPIESEQVKPTPRPTREQFDFDDDLYDQAIDRWNDEKIERKLNSHYNTSQQQAQQEKQKQEFQLAQTKNLNDHYDRAQKLVDDGKITEDAFRNSDQIVRTSLERQFQGEGNDITNTLISTLNSTGDDSEKVMFLLGNNPAKMQELQNLLSIQDGGLSAAMFLGQLQRDVKTPVKRRSQAPRPGSSAEGESGNGGKAGTLQKQYSKAESVQERISLKRAAAKNGVDTSKW
jgi:hypothetical protein